MKIAIIEDTRSLAKLISRKLKKSGYQTSISNSIEEFKSNILDNADLFIIDINLGDGEGFEIINWLRNVKFSKKPILIMSAYSDINNKLKGFSLGIDDYICKPIIPDELIARVGVLLKRAPDIKTREILHNGYVFDFENKELFKDGVNFYLTRRESQIIEFFLLNKGKVISKDELINSVWGKLDLLNVTFNNINVTICNTRKKIGDKFGIETLLGVGYILR